MALTGANTLSLKQLNKNIILRLLLEKSPLTKAKIADQTHVTFATVSNLVTEMLEENLVLELGYAVSKGGRKPALYGVNPEAFFFIGIDLQVEKIICVLTDFKGAIVHSDSVQYQVEDGPHSAVKTIRSLVDSTLLATKAPYSKVQGIGVSAPGPIDSKQGIIMSPPNMPGWRNVPFRDLLSVEFRVPCYLEKDANAAALGESRYGAGRDVNALVYMMVDVGIGGGIVVQNNILRGFLNGAGEIGHMMMEKDGPECNCGNNGCLEAVASGLAIEREVRKELGRPFKLDEAIEKSDGTYPVLDKFLVQAGEYLGTAIGNVCNVLNPPLVILGGKVIDCSDLYFKQAIIQARKRILPEFAQRVQIVRSKLGRLSGAIGAATIVFDNTFNQTLWEEVVGR